MWNFNIRLGTIWTLKSFNEFDENYLGMRNSEQIILILSSYIDENDIGKFTYLSIERTNRNPISLYKDIDLYKSTYYINCDNIYTGDRRALNQYITSLSEIEIKEILNMINLHFNFFNKKKQKEVVEVPIIKSITDVEDKVKEEKSTTKKKSTSKKTTNKKVSKSVKSVNTNTRKKYVKIHKYGMDIKFVPSEDIYLLDSGRLFISKKARNYILRTADYEKISNKYDILPVKAIGQIRSRLVYRAKNK